MPITINGSGSIAGLSVGGLPDGSVNNADLAANAVSTGKILNGAVTTAKLGSDEQSGLCKAWVNFNGTGTVAIRAQYNVSSITDNGTGNYTVNFATALADANYSVAGLTARVTDETFIGRFGATPTTTALRFVVFDLAGNAVDSLYSNISIFR
jgi:hypothetical protein